MNGEIGIAVKNVSSDQNFVRPDPNWSLNNDLVIEGDHERLYICGDNDWGYLACDLLKPIYDEAENIIETVKKKKENESAVCVVLGKNDMRIMDIYFGGHDKCKEILGLPAIRKDDELNYIGFLYRDEIRE